MGWGGARQVPRARPPESRPPEHTPLPRPRGGEASEDRTRCLAPSPRRPHQAAPGKGAPFLVLGDSWAPEGSATAPSRETRGQFPHLPLQPGLPLGAAGAAGQAPTGPQAPQGGLLSPSCRQGLRGPERPPELKVHPHDHPGSVATPLHRGQSPGSDRHTAPGHSAAKGRVGTQKRLRRAAPAGPPSPHMASPGSGEESLLPAMTRQPRQPDTLCPRRPCRAGRIEISPSPRRRCSPPASATGFSVLASDEGTPQGLGSHMSAAAGTSRTGPATSLGPEGSPPRTGQQPPQRPAEPASTQWARTRPGQFLPGDLPQARGSESQTHQVGLSLGTAAQAHPGSPPSTYAVAEGLGHERAQQE